MLNQRIFFFHSFPKRGKIQLSFQSNLKTILKIWMNRAHFVQIFIEFYLKIRKIKSVNYGCSIYVKIRAKQKIYGLQLFTIMINNKDFRNLRKGL